MPNLQRIKGINYDGFYLAWDTEYFGVSSARVNLTDLVNEEGQNRIIEFCNRYEFVTISNINNVKENNYWIGKKTNAFLTDMNIQFIKKNLESKMNNQDEKTYVINKLSENEQIVEIARKSFLYSRFFNDPKLPVVQAKNIYPYWTICAFDQNNKYFVVCEREGKVAGYILFSIEDNISIIELIAVDVKYQGQRVGKSLIDAMESYVLNKGINSIKVGTQVDNVLASQFYSKMGFKYVMCGSIYHMWRR